MKSHENVLLWVAVDVPIALAGRHVPGGSCLIRPTYLSQCGGRRGRRMTRGRVRGFIEVSRESIQKRCPGPQGKKARGAAAPCAALATMPWFPGQRFQAQTATGVDEDGE